jgi:hypothetical protein
MDKKEKTMKKKNKERKGQIRVALHAQNYSSNERRIPKGVL